MANREQRSNKEKKKPKAGDKAKDNKSSSPTPFVQPELVRKPHKGKDWT
jgi:hypothetical protein